MRRADGLFLRTHQRDKMWRRWCTCASVYLVGENIGAWLRDEPVDPTRVTRTTLVGATTDAFVLRSFHRVVDRRLPSPFLRMLAEQSMYAPLSNMGYLTLVHGRQWEWDEWRRVYARDCLFWPVASYIGYRYVPFPQRYLYVSFATLVWTTGRSAWVHNKHD